MSGAGGFLQILALVAVMIGFGLVMCAPDILFGLLRARQEDEEQALRRQAELERKLAIAEAANAARARGETFVPPADYDR